ncbi:polyphosphate kinase 2 [Pseudomonas sp. JM0905a]|uniref:polyphosphate kinase 2 n=1 Tax=Pseudomonas sp. JM0905a TaxID=2772484 RepID=UPI0016855D2E|nr:polyphosphate kinase 2 [Pseudomonas sp. JM0905a]MBD2837710.1 polyphosphate kinase 2 [Pseudomonas sp. JM0905a]
MTGKSDKSRESSKAPRMPRKEYEAELKRLHVELVKLQRWVVQEGMRICIVFEGRDGAGKGGVIKALTERTSSRIFRSVALPTPTEREKSQMYVQRYISHFPAGGEVVIFDRSWYNRAGVERVMGFCSDKDVEKFFAFTPLFERAVVESGIILLKYWLEVSPEEQQRRLEDRINDGRKTWKLSPMDIRSFGRWDEYTRARDEMFIATDTSWAPWHIARSEDKRRVRLNVIRHILAQVPYREVRDEKEVRLPKRGKLGAYQSPDYPFRYIEEKY